MTALWYVGVQSVDRSQRQVRLWLMRCYPGESLPTTYGFFCGLLTELFTPVGYGERLEGMIMGMHPNNPRQMIESVKMIRYCEPPPEENRETSVSDGRQQPAGPTSEAPLPSSA